MQSGVQFVKRGWFRFRKVLHGLGEAMCISGFRVLIASPLGSSSESLRRCADSTLLKIKTKDIYCSSRSGIWTAKGFGASGS
jgi:hypothetical protein